MFRVSAVIMRITVVSNILKGEFPIKYFFPFFITKDFTMFCNGSVME